MYVLYYPCIYLLYRPGVGGRGLAAAARAALPASEDYCFKPPSEHLAS